MSSSFLPSGGPLLAADNERVYVASGFGEAGPGQSDHVVTALDRNTGRTRWTVKVTGPPFLQGVVDGVLVISEQYKMLRGVETASGRERWAIDLSGAGLDGYGATVSATTDGMAAVGLSAQVEGDTRPPVIVGIDAASGRLRWHTMLNSGTDLNRGSPAIIDGAAVFLSTLSHLGSAPGNTAHAVNLSDGAVRWSVDLGGSQGFHVVGPAVSRGGVHLPAPGALVTTDPATGVVQWRRETGPLPVPAVVADLLWLLESDRLIVLDPVTGQELSMHGTDRQFLGERLLIDVPQRRVVLAVDRLHAQVTDPVDFTSASWDWPGPLVDAPLASNDLVVVATDRRITAYVMPKSAKR